WYYRGITLSILGRNEEALEAYGKTLMLEPLHSGAWEGEAKAYLALGKKREALRTCEKALELEPASAVAWETQGRILEGMGRKEEALSAFEKSLIIEPRNTKNRLERGRLLGKLGRPREALDIFESVLELDNSLIEAKAGKGKALLALGKYQESLDAFRKALEANPLSLEGWRGVGNCFLAMQRPYEALQAYEKALSSGVEDSGILSGLGEVYYQLGDYSRSLESFEEALGLYSRNLFAWNGKGNALYKLGRYREALDAYETLLELDYESLPARYNRGVTLSRLRHQEKDFGETLGSQLQTAFKKYLELSGGLPEREIGDESWKYRGFAFAELGEYAEALKAFDNAAKRESERSFPQICKGITLLCLRMYEEALKTLEDAEEAIYAAAGAEKSTKILEDKEPEILNSAEINFRLEILRNSKGLALNALGRYQDALIAFESARELSEAETISYSGKGLVFAHCGEWGKALEVFDRILTLDPQNTQASVMKAFVLIRLQEFEKAVAVLEKLTDEINSDFPACLLGFAYFRLKDFDRAIKAYRKAIDINPKNFHARNGLAELYFRIGNSRGALKELEASIAEAPDNAFSRNLKGRIELEEQACEDALESFRRALALNSEDLKLLLWDAYARYMCAETSFDENSARFRYTLLAAAGKLEKAAILQRSKDNELKAYALYFLGLFYYRAHYFRKSVDRLDECLRLESPAEVKKPAARLLKNLRTGPFKPAWWEWWLYSKTHGLLKKMGFVLIFLFVFVLLLSHPAALSLPIISWPASYINSIFSLTGNVSWPIYDREYIIFILFLAFILFLPEFRQVRPNEEDFEPLTPPYPDLDIPASILEEFGEKLERSLFSPEPMEESVQKLGNF
ncbi:tetratricopeptide repeat protein, partial [Methanosarcina sp. UBA411]|uniref:tetratricopeptide repeat protein n=1 Tax=Methanosarcina sp. UBA411 TaxID=1915589 RepID=UPI0025EB1904